MPSTAPHPHPANPTEQQAEDSQYYRRVLHELIDMGADLARTVHRQAVAQTGPEDAADGPAALSARDAAVAFDRISRAVRRTVALARRIAEPLPERAAARPERDRALARRRILRDVQDAIQREAEGTDVETLEAELSERLDAPELDDEIGNRPVAEVVADICRDLGLGPLLGNHPWKRRTPEDIAAMAARAARPPGSPPCADPPPAPEVGGRFRTWAGPMPFSEEASIELMHKLLEFRPSRIRGP